jgi:hypothetical protein
LCSIDECMQLSTTIFKLDKQKYERLENANFITDNCICTITSITDYSNRGIFSYSKKISHVLKYFYEQTPNNAKQVKIDPFDKSFIFYGKSIWLVKDLTNEAFCKIEIYKLKNKHIEHSQTTSLAGYFLEAAYDSSNVFVATTNEKYNLGKTDAVFKLDFDGNKLETLNVKFTYCVKKMQIFRNCIFFLTRDNSLTVYDIKNKIKMVKFIYII